MPSTTSSHTRAARRRMQLLVFLVCGCMGPVQAEPNLRIGVVDDQAPCSDVASKSFRGSAVDVWHQVADRAGLRYQFIAFPNPNAAVRAAAEGQIDLAVSCLNITPLRLQEVAFTTPYSDDGLSLLTRRKQKKLHHGDQQSALQLDH